MNKVDVLKMINGLQRLLAEMDEHDEELEEISAPPHPRQCPKLEEVCYYIENTGYISTTSYNLNTASRQEIGNIFKSLKDAEFAVERLKVLSEMREWAGKWDDPYIIMYSGDEKVCHVHEMAFHFLNGGGMRFATQEDAENCIQAVGEDKIKKYYFMIPEETRI